MNRYRITNVHKFDKEVNRCLSVTMLTNWQRRYMYLTMFTNWQRDHQVSCYNVHKLTEDKQVSCSNVHKFWQRDEHIPCYNVHKLSKEEQVSCYYVHKLTKDELVSWYNVHILRDKTNKLLSYYFKRNLKRKRCQTTHYAITSTLHQLEVIKSTLYTVGSTWENLNTEGKRGEKHTFADYLKSKQQKKKEKKE